MNARIGFKLQLTATLGFHLHYDWCFQTMWLFACVPEDPEDDTVMEKHSAEAFYSALKSLIHAIRTKDEEAKQDVADRIFQIAKPWMIRRWSESKLASGNPLIEIQKIKADLIDLE
jgi:hypothetical protein